MSYTPTKAQTYWQHDPRSLTAGVSHLEQIQRLMTRIIKDFRHFPYNETLRQLGWRSLIHCGIPGHLVVVHNIIKGSSSCKRGCDFKVFHCPSRHFRKRMGNELQEQAAHQFLLQPLSSVRLKRQFDSTINEKHHHINYSFASKKRSPVFRCWYRHAGVIIQPSSEGNLVEKKFNWDKGRATR